MKGITSGPTTLVVVCLAFVGCTTPSITGVDLESTDKDAPQGIPYYLPKPYLIVTKNIRYIPTPTVGLTQTAPIPNSFDPSAAAAAAASPGGSKDGGSSGGSSSGGAGHGSSSSSSGGSSSSGAGHGGSSSSSGGSSSSGAGHGGSSSSSSGGSSSGGSSSGGTHGSSSSSSSGGTNAGGNQQVLGPASIAVVPPASIPDGLTPETFYTYQIVYLPDLSHRYGLRVKGGSGEMRTTLNIVNGWMFTGPGPTYLRDSFTSEKVQAGGSAVSGILDSAATFVTSLAGGPAAALTQAATQKSKTAVGPTAAETKPGTGQPTLDLGQKIDNYAEIYVFEPQVTRDSSGHVTAVAWAKLDALHVSFDRNVVAVTPPSGSPNPTATSSPTAAQITSALKKITLDDGAAGAQFKITSASVDTTKMTVTVVVDASAANMPLNFDDASLKAGISSKVVGKLKSIGVTDIYVVTVDDSKVSQFLKPQ